MSVVNLTVVHREQEAQILDELIGSFAYGLTAKGHIVYTSLNAIKKDAVNIVFASHVSPSTLASQLPADSILYNTESVGSIWMTEEYIKLLKSFKVWDYSQYNSHLLNNLLNRKIQHAPIGFCPTLERIQHLPEEEKDIDVLLYGSVNERRRNIMEALHAKGLKTMFVYDAFGEMRDNLIARSRIVLNVHYYESAILETVRLSYLLNNKCFVVSEMSKDWKYCDPYYYTMVVADYRTIVDDCMEYVHAPKRRQNIADCGYLIFKEYKQEEIVNDIT